MKTYTKPSVQTFEFFAQEMLAASGTGVESGNSVSKTVSSGSQKTRENGGFGGGLWEDMQ
ncbi:MAG: hypothetical protein IJ692_00120 [Alloprevotella sp.]|nr:hypothetical protein [Alloprevotella sp.]